MADLTFILTTAGLAALVNPANTGTNAIVVDRIGVSAVALPGAPETNAGLLALPNELKRLPTFGGAVVGDQTIHVAIRDESPDVYQLRTFGLYSEAGVLLAYYTQAASIMEKSAGSMLLLAADLKFTTPISAELVFGDTNFVNPPATTTQMGVVELATAAETAAGTDATRAVTPFGLLSVLAAWASNFAAAVHTHTMDQVLGLAAALGGKSSIGHTHAAADTTSGVFDVARIPDLALAKVTGLVAALAGKAAASHTHFMSEVTGLVDALNAKAASVHTHALSSVDGLTQALAGKAAAAHTHVMGEINGLTEALAGKAAAAHTHVLGEIVGLVAALNSKATLTATVRFASVELGTGNGVVYGDGDRLLARTGPAGAERYFGFNVDGSFNAYNGPVISVNGRCWDPGNFNPATKADASDWTNPSAEVVVTGYKGFTSTGSSIANGTDGHGALEVRSTDGNRAAYMAFHRPGQQAAFFGLDNDGRWKVGGWSMGAVGYTLHHEGNLRAAEGAEVVAGQLHHGAYLTPAGLFQFARNLGSPGYAVIPGTGLMLQWGISAGSTAEGEAAASLPVAFGGGCLVALAVPRNPSRNINTDFYMQVAARFIDRIVFFANRANGSSGNLDGGFEWIALGKVSGTPDPAYSAGGTGGSGGLGGGGGEVTP